MGRGGGGELVDGGSVGFHRGGVGTERRDDEEDDVDEGGGVADISGLCKGHVKAAPHNFYPVEGADPCNCTVSAHVCYK